jgi:hypothetical protein
LAIRSFQDTEGTTWRVWRVLPQKPILVSTSPGLARGWLCFESASGKRRLADPPDGWEEHPESALLELLGRATAVRARAAREAEPA